MRAERYLAYRLHWILTACLFAALVGSHPVSAHLMEEQHGTLNFKEKGAFVAVSIPVQALKNFDDDSDGRMSAAELKAHYDSIAKQLRSRLRLRQGRSFCRLEGLVINFSHQHSGGAGAATHIIVMGRFALKSARGAATLKLDLFGSQKSEQEIRLQVRRGAQKRVVIFTKRNNTQPIVRIKAS